MRKMNGRRRMKLTKRHSKKLFTRTARRTRKENTRANPMRGGIRL